MMRRIGGSGIEASSASVQPLRSDRAHGFIGQPNVPDPGGDLKVTTQSRGRAESRHVSPAKVWLKRPAPWCKPSGPAYAATANCALFSKACDCFARCLLGTVDDCACIEPTGVRS